MPSRLDAVDRPVPRRAAVTVMPAVPNKPIARITMPIMISSTATPLRFGREVFFGVVVVMCLQLTVTRLNPVRATESCRTKLPFARVMVNADELTPFGKICTEDGVIVTASSMYSEVLPSARR